MTKHAKDTNPLIEYRNGGEGFIKWCEENVVLLVYDEDSVTPRPYLMGKLPDTVNPETGKSYKSMWEEQKVIFREALTMKKGRFKHRLIVLCWPRGDGKSLDVCLIQLWKFFNWPKQLITCGANSKDQTKFVHYDIMRDIILQSPKLLAKIGKKSIKEKHIEYRDSRGHLQSTIRCISSFSGIVSNITGYTFSEIFDMKNPKFFTQLDGSIRNIPNAIGCIDSTVSEKDHILFKLYETFVDQKDPTLFFSYRCSQEGEVGDYMNPMMTTQQLESYRAKFLEADFARYFKNLWSAGRVNALQPEQVEATHYLGLDKSLVNQKELIELIKAKNEYIENAAKVQDGSHLVNMGPVDAMRNRLWPVNDIYGLQDDHGNAAPISLLDLITLGDMYDTDWGITTALDRADPGKTPASRLGARTVFAAVAKGLPGSRSIPLWQLQDKENIPYIYLLIHLVNIEDHSLEKIKQELTCIHDLLEIDVFGSERWGAWDLVPWCEPRGIPVELWQPTFDRQKAMFSELIMAYRFGRFKSPALVIQGSKGKDDILIEEAKNFDYDPDAKWFGSPDKNRKDGIQDDAFYAVANAIFAGRELTVNDFRERKGKINFGFFIQPEQSPLGIY